jgi:nitroreductase
MDYDSLLKLVKSRRSIRKFKPDPIPDEYVDKIIEVARWAPSGANSQPWQFIVIKKEELRKKVFEIVSGGTEGVKKVEMIRDEDIRFNWEAVGWDKAPVYIMVCGDSRLKDCFPLMPALSAGDAILESSLASTFLYMMLAANTLGLGAQWTTAVSTPHLQLLLKRLLGIPKELFIYDMMVVGYPDMVPPPRVVRDKKEIVHYDGYDQSKFPTDKQVREFVVKLRKSMPM